MASKKDFRGKKPAIAIEANAVEAFLNNVSHEEEQPVPVVKTKKSPTLPAPAETKAADQRRNKGIHFLTSVSIYEYLKQVAWENRQSVNDYINTLIEADKNRREREGK